MSTHNYIGKYRRLQRAAAKEPADRGEYLSTTFFGKGGHVGELSLWDNCMEWDVFADAAMTQHLDWNHPDCTCLNDLSHEPVSPLRVVARLNYLGWELIKAYDGDGKPIKF